jgi:hypothetical protein
LCLLIYVFVYLERTQLLLFPWWNYTHLSKPSSIQWYCLKARRVRKGRGLRKVG